MATHEEILQHFQLTQLTKAYGITNSVMHSAIWLPVYVNLDGERVNVWSASFDRIINQTMWFEARSFSHK